MSSTHIAGVNPKEYNGVKYKSTLEARTAETLDKLGIPWEYESKTYTLQEGFYCPWQKKKVIAVTYTPDFCIGPVMIETKGFETPDFILKKKMFFKLLSEQEPEAIYYIIKNPQQLLLALDPHWSYLGYAIQVTPKSPSNSSSKKSFSKKSRLLSGESISTPPPPSPQLFDSITQALDQLNLKGKSLTPILRSLTGDKDYVYNYNWKLYKLNI